MRGVIFDIEEFAVYDGPGIRSVVFIKGCPMRCMWCHNPEGLSAHPFRAVTESLCAHCGACKRVCQSPMHCTACGECVKVCPRGCIHIVGQEIEAEEVAARVRRNEKLLQMNGGGITFSGGEALTQPDFVREIRRLLPDLHAAIETSGCAPRAAFESVIKDMDFIIMDLKLIDPAAHRHYTGVDNHRILENFSLLKSSLRPFRVRVPLIPTVTDTEENLRAVAGLLKGAQALEKVELLRYNKAAGAKYSGTGIPYAPTFPEDRAPETHEEIFREARIPCSVL